MKISVVTISLNQAPFLRECMDSVLSQNRADIEYILVDPGSTDGSREIIQSYGDRVIKIFEKDMGPADGLNKGFARATGDIFYFINSDDYVLPDIFSDVLQTFRENPNVDLILAGGLRVNQAGDTECSFYPSKVSAKAYVNGAVTLFQQGMFFKSELFRAVNGFNVENGSCWDGELLLKFVLVDAKIKRLMRKVAAFRIYPASITGSQRFASRFAADHKRLFALVYGSDRRPSRFVVVYFRLMKVLMDPRYLYKRLVG